MMMFFVGSESFFFLALLISYVYYSHPGGSLSQTASFLNVSLTAVFSIFLFTSSLTIRLAEKAMMKGNLKRCLVWLLITIGFGLVFLAGQAHEYAGLISDHITISRDVFGSAFFTLTGFHGLHVLIGIITLSIFAIMLYSKKFSRILNSTFASAAIYWHFVDAVWVVVFSVIYIGAVI
jgi:cytochrome c oxidase subunit 3